jgi:hypothetical protein
VIGFRQCDARWPFLWEGAGQPEGRWHGAGDGPAHYIADTPDGAWADFLRHEEIRDAADLKTIRRAIWAVAFPDEPAATPALPAETMRGDRSTFAACQEAARRLRAAGHRRLHVPSPALVDGGARARAIGGDDSGDSAGHRVAGARGESHAERRDGRIVVLFGGPSELNLVGWPVALQASPAPDLLSRVRHYS